MTQPTFIANNVADVLAAVPTFFGFVPSESVIAVATHGPRTQFGFRLRFDLPPPEHVDDVAAAVEQHICAQDPDGVVLIVLSERQEFAELMLQALLDRFDDIDIVVCVRADGSHYWVPGEPGPVAYDASLHHPAVVEAIAAGQEILGSRDELAARFAAVDDPEVAGEVERVLADVLPAMAKAVSPADLEKVGVAAAGPALERALAARGAIDPGDIALLGVWSSAIVVRDALWMRISGPTAADMLRVWADVARRVPEGFAPAALCLAGFAAWLCGDGVQASIAAGRAEQIDPHYSFAGLLLDILQSGFDPRRWSGWGPSGTPTP